MIVSNGFTAYSGFPSQTAVSQAGFNSNSKKDRGQGQTSSEQASEAILESTDAGAPKRSSKVVISADGSTIMQHTTINPSGSMMRKNVTLHQPQGSNLDPIESEAMLRRRSEAYEGMMLLY